jgi:hypothetical protein
MSQTTIVNKKKSVKQLYGLNDFSLKYPLERPSCVWVEKKYLFVGRKLLIIPPTIRNVMLQFFVLTELQ